MACIELMCKCVREKMCVCVSMCVPVCEEKKYELFLKEYNFIIFSQVQVKHSYDWLRADKQKSTGRYS